jgi:hypothetical protein
MCNQKRVFLVLCLIGSYSAIIKPMNWEEGPQRWESERWLAPERERELRELDEYKKMAMNKLNGRFNLLLKKIADDKSRLLQYAAKAGTLQRVLEKEVVGRGMIDDEVRDAKFNKDAGDIAQEVVRGQITQQALDNCFKEISQSPSATAVNSIVDHYNNLMNSVSAAEIDIDGRSYKKARYYLAPEYLIQKAGLFGWEDVLKRPAEEVSARIYEYSDDLKPRNQLPIPEVSKPLVGGFWRNLQARIQNYLFGGPSSSNLGFVQVPPRVQTRPYSFGIPQPMRDRFQMLKQQARAFPTRQMTPQEQRQEQESRFYNRRTIPNPENVFVAPY